MKSVLRFLVGNQDDPNWPNNPNVLTEHEKQRRKSRHKRKQASRRVHRMLSNQKPAEGIAMKKRLKALQNLQLERKVLVSFLTQFIQEMWVSNVGAYRKIASDKYNNLFVSDT